MTATTAANRWALTLYAKGASPISIQAIEAVRGLSDIVRVRRLALGLGVLEMSDDSTAPRG